jgi:hypothetical protein
MTESVEDVEMWMREQPIGLRRFERHDRLRLKIAGGSNVSNVQIYDKGYTI